MHDNFLFFCYDFQTLQELFAYLMESNYILIIYFEKIMKTENKLNTTIFCLK